ncbi:DUF2141 domain-containing protein [bacterium]|nr:DUF2141 domain-containing protein [bacterium]
MKKISLIITTLLLGFTLSAQTGQVQVNITGITPEWGGTVRIGLYLEDGFPTVGKSQVNKVMLATKLKDLVTFKDIPAGTYGIAIFQDINSDGKLNRNFYGAPTEPFGFSNNKFGRFGPPKFAEVAFAVTSGDSTALIINLE